jgi:hypothetical protein
MGEHHADVAQLVEHHLAKVGVAGSNPVVRSKGLADQRECAGTSGGLLYGRGEPTNGVRNLLGARIQHLLLLLLLLPFHLPLGSRLALSSD